MEQSDAIANLYLQNLSNTKAEKNYLTADCPFCRKKGLDPQGKFVVFLKKSGFFHGYFRCLNRCVPGGFPLWFAKLSGLDPLQVPGFDPDREPPARKSDYPVANLNKEIDLYHESLTPALLERFQEAGVGESLLAEQQIGFNGRYLVYPYIRDDNNCYAARCVFPGRSEDVFWHGEEQVFGDHARIFNVQDIGHCENGSLFLCAGEDNLLVLKQLGFPGVAVPDHQNMEGIDPEQFGLIKNIFLVMENSGEAELCTYQLASRIGYKVRPFKWSYGLPQNYTVWQFAKDKGKQFRALVSTMVNEAKPFSPFVTPERENNHFFEQLALEGGTSYASLQTGFPFLDQALDGVHGINIIGGAPKSGKSTFMIQMATEMALRKIPVLYYDFENGRQKIYQRTLCRLSRQSTESIRLDEFSDEQQKQYDKSCSRFKEMLTFFRVVNDRQVTPEIMRQHIDFIRHETNSIYTVVVIDSLHKLPFKDFSERRTGIDAWLRQLESIRDELRVSFLVVSELSRGVGESYSESPHLGVFKGSGDIEYSADNAMVLFPDWDPLSSVSEQSRKNKLWLVASREHSPGLVAEYEVDYPYWGFVEHKAGDK